MDVYSDTDDPILDNNSSTATINVLSKPVPPVNGKTVGIQGTGMPSPLLLLSIVLVLAGILMPRKK